MSEIIDITNPQWAINLKWAANALRQLDGAIEDYSLIGTSVGLLYDENSPEEFQQRILDNLLATNTALEAIGLPHLEIKTERSKQ